MNTKEACKHVTDFSYMVTQMYVNDLADADLLVRSVPGTNHIAWQLGHLITAVNYFVTALGQPGVQLPEGFDAMHSKETAASDDATKFLKKDDYLKLMEQTKQALHAAIDAVPDAQWDNPGPESMREYAPTVASVLMLGGTHWLMHAGQFVPIRRKLGKPALF